MGERTAEIIEGTEVLHGDVEKPVTTNTDSIPEPATAEFLTNYRERERKLKQTLLVLRRARSFNADIPIKTQSSEVNFDDVNGTIDELKLLLSSSGEILNSDGFTLGFVDAFLSRYKGLMSAFNTLKNDILIKREVEERLTGKLETLKVEKKKQSPFAVLFNPSDYFKRSKQEKDLKKDYLNLSGDILNDEHKFYSIKSAISRIEYEWRDLLFKQIYDLYNKAIENKVPMMEVDISPEMTTFLNDKWIEDNFSNEVRSSMGVGVWSVGEDLISDHLEFVKKALEIGLTNRPSGKTSDSDILEERKKLEAEINSLNQRGYAFSTNLLFRLGVDSSLEGGDFYYRFLFNIFLSFKAKKHFDSLISDEDLVATNGLKYALDSGIKRTISNASWSVNLFVDGHALSRWKVVRNYFLENGLMTELELDELEDIIIELGTESTVRGPLSQEQHVNAIEKMGSARIIKPFLKLLTQEKTTSRYQFANSVRNIVEKLDKIELEKILPTLAENERAMLDIILDANSFTNRFSEGAYFPTICEYATDYKLLKVLEKYTKYLEENGADGQQLHDFFWLENEADPIKKIKEISKIFNDDVSEVIPAAAKRVISSIDADSLDVGLIEEISVDAGLRPIEVYLLIEKKLLDSDISNPERFFDELVKISQWENGSSKELVSKFIDKIVRGIRANNMDISFLETICEKSGIEKSVVFEAVKKNIYNRDLPNSTDYFFEKYSGLVDWAEVDKRKEYSEFLVELMRRYSFSAIGPQTLEKISAVSGLSNIEIYKIITQYLDRKRAPVNGEADYVKKIIWLSNWASVSPVDLLEECLQSYVGKIDLEHFEDLLFSGDSKPSKTDSKITDFIKAMSVSFSLFGNAISNNAFELVKKIINNQLSNGEMKAIGINKTGNEGVKMLRDRLAKFKGEIIGSSFDPELYLAEGFMTDYFKAQIRFAESQFGQHGDYYFDRIIKGYVEKKKDGKLRDLPETFVPSGEILVDKIDEESNKNIEYTEQFVSRFNVLKTSVLGSLSLLESNAPFSDVIKKILEKKSAVVESLKEKLGRMNNPKAIENLKTRIEKIENIDLRSVKDFQSNFLILSEFNEFHEELRQIVFFYALRSNSGYADNLDNIFRKEKPDIDDLSYVIDFVNHIVNQETWRDYFTDKRSMKAFREITSVRALEEEFSRIQDRPSKGKMSLEFIPNRGLLTEFSGHISDACWASKYDSMLETFPNFSSVIMMQNRGTKFERMAGASMLIETTSEDGTPLLVIRGLNPIQNLINTLSAEDFFDKFTAYIRTIADKSGRKAAIVIDDHSGGSGTNRPTLFNYLVKKKDSLVKVRLNSDSDTGFNGYNIVNQTYLL